MSSSRLTKIKDFFRDHVFANFYAFHAEKKIRKQIADIEREQVQISFDEDLDLDGFIQELKEQMEKEEDRRKVIDDKAKSSLVGITVATTVMLAGLNIIKEGKLSFGGPVLAIVILGVAFFALSAITSVKSLNLSAFYGTHPNDWIHSKDGVDTITNLKKVDRIRLLLSIIKLNERVLNIRSNFVSSTLEGLRNGVILLLLAFVIALSDLGKQVKYIDGVVVTEQSGKPPKNDDRAQQTGSSEQRTESSATSNSNSEPVPAIPKAPVKAIIVLPEAGRNVPRTNAATTKQRKRTRR